MGWMDSLDSILHIAVIIGVWVAEIIGVLIAVVTVVQALWGWIYHKERVRLLLGEGISLALQFKLAGEVLRTVIVRNWTEIGILGAIILIRFAITFLIHWEIKNEEKRIEHIHREEEKVAVRKAMRRVVEKAAEGVPEQSRDLAQEDEHSRT